jgi:hypothetical protein
VFELLVRDFDQDAWVHTGRKPNTPVHLAFHILKSVKFYMEDATPIHFPSGRILEKEWETVKEEDLPTQNDLVDCILEMKGKTDSWLSGMDFSDKNTTFDWAGETRLGVVIFSLRHFLYHLGELSSLLNESKNGVVEDNYVKA